MNATRFAYLGPEGTFAEAALSRAVPESEGRRAPQPSVPAALAAVRSGDADAALVPLENSVEGAVPATMDGLADGDPLVITREVLLPVTMTLVARPGTTLADVRSLASNPHAIAQSARWLAEHLPQVTPLPTTSTATAAAAVAAGDFDAAVRADRQRQDVAGRRRRGPHRRPAGAAAGVRGPGHQADSHRVPADPGA